MEPKDYQTRALERVKAYLQLLYESKQTSDRIVVEHGPELAQDFPAQAWKKIDGLYNAYHAKRDGLGRPLPCFCLKIPTGGGKTFLAVKTIDLVNTAYLKKRTGLVLWIVPTTQIYRQTLKSLKDRDHPYRQHLDIASGGRTTILEKTDRFTPDDIATNLGMALPTGVLINDVYPGGPADRAGVEVGDVILSVSGHELNDPQALRFRIATLVIGEKADLAVWRRGREVDLALDVTPPPEEPPREQTELSGRHPLSGAAVANMSPALAEELGLEKIRPGVFVLAIRRGGAASRLGFRPGDAILSINGEAVKSVRSLKRLLSEPADRWRVTLERGGKTLNWVIDA